IRAFALLFAQTVASLRPLSATTIEVGRRAPQNLVDARTLHCIRTTDNNGIRPLSPAEKANSAIQCHWGSPEMDEMTAGRNFVVANTKRDLIERSFMPIAPRPRFYIWSSSIHKAG